MVTQDVLAFILIIWKFLVSYKWLKKKIEAHFLAIQKINWHGY